MTLAKFQQEAGLHLASAGAGPGGGGGGTHKASTKPWTTAGGVAGELHQDMETAVKDLGHAHDGLKSGTAGFTSASTLSGILGGWESRLGAVRDACKGLDGDLKKAGVEFHENDVRVKQSFDAARTKSKIDDYGQPSQRGASK
jgi:hypothetical protein